LKFQAGGTLHEDSIYIERKADIELLKSLEDGEFCCVFAPSQSGKSSLKMHTVKKLRDEGKKCALINLQRFGTSDITVDKFYASMVENVAKSLELNFDVLDFWKSKSYKLPIERWINFIDEIIYSDDKTNHPDDVETAIVDNYKTINDDMESKERNLPSKGYNSTQYFIFIDEIDLDQMPFSVDDFFNWIKYINYKKKEDYKYKKIVFCLMGVVNWFEVNSSLDFLKFIYLNDFTFEEFRLSKDWLNEYIYDLDNAINDIYEWTSGHPYMTMKICEVISIEAKSHKEKLNSKNINEIVTNIFIKNNSSVISLSTTKQYFAENNFEDVTFKMLDVYSNILKNRKIEIKKLAPEHIKLLMTGLISKSHIDQKIIIRPRNKIYESVFNQLWIDNKRNIFYRFKECNLNTDKYKIIACHAEGSFGVVYKAHDTTLDRLVAIKQLKKEKIKNEKLLEKFCNEAKITAQFDHPNIVKILDYNDKTHAIFMDFIQGKTLKKIIAEKQLEENQIIDIGIQISNALHYAHTKGIEGKSIIHRDIKPSNILLTYENKVKITDFGVAKVIDIFGNNELSHCDVGTFEYMSPEQLNRHNIDGRSDLFSIGVVLYEMTTRKRPFRSIDRTRRPDEPIEVNSKISQSLSDIIMKCLNFEPKKRYKDCNELENALQELKKANEPQKNYINSESPKNKSSLKIFIPLLILIIIPFFYYISNHLTKQTKIIYFQTDPQNADVHINNKYMGKTPINIPLTYGLYNLSFRLENYEKHLSELIVNSETENDVSTILKRIKYKIEFKSDPDNADIYINNNYKGKTPTTIMLPIGLHIFRLEYYGYKEYNSEIEINEKNNKNQQIVQAKLEPIN